MNKNFLITLSKKVIRLLSLAIIFGFIVGIFVGVNHISNNQYIKYRMFRLVLYTTVKDLNYWLVASIFFFTVVAVYWFIIKTIRQLFINTFELHIKNKKTFLTAVILLFTALICYVWVDINKCGLSLQSHPVRFIFSTMFFLVVIYDAFWTLINRKRRIKYSKNRISYWVVSLTSVLLIVLILNIYTLTDSKIAIPKGPNVIFIVIDTLRADHLGCYGYARNTTPNIDKLANESILFKNVIAPSPWTCPSIGALFTSRYPASLGITEAAINISDKFVLLSEVFKEHNYKTHGIISSVYVSSKYGYAQGFDSYDEENAKGEQDISSPSIAQKASSFIEQNRSNKFFLFLHWFDPHYSYMLHKKYNYYPDYNGPICSGMNINELWFKAPYMSANDITHIKALYDSEITFTDEYIGTFINRLKALGLYDDTLIILTADHGEEFSERGDYYIGHTRKLFQEMIHVPLIIKLPGKIKKKTIDGNIGLIDVMPTIVDFLNLKIPDGYQYAGEVINLETPDPPQNRMIFCETRWTLNFQAVINQEWKLIQYPEMRIKMLFNLGEDPGETKNIIAINEKKAHELEAALKRWNQEKVLESSHVIAQKTVFSEEEKARLKALGYLQ